MRDSQESFFFFTPILFWSCRDRTKTQTGDTNDSKHSVAFRVRLQKSRMRRHEFSGNKKPRNVPTNTRYPGIASSPLHCKKDAQKFSFILSSLPPRMKGREAKVTRPKFWHECCLSFSPIRDAQRTNDPKSRTKMKQKISCREEKIEFQENDFYFLILYTADRFSSMSESHSNTRLSMVCVAG
jgi:hypothetical protein